MDSLNEPASRRERERLLKKRLQDDPFLTDEELSRSFGVSVQTVRLDRMRLGIPELRVRLKEMAENAYRRVKSVELREIVGELVDVEPGSRGISILGTHEGMALARTGMVRGQYIFAQADSLALSIIDSDVVLTGLANAKFKRAVRVGERLVAKAEVLRRRNGRYVVLVQTRSGDEVVFRGKFVLYALESEEMRTTAVPGGGGEG